MTFRLREDIIKNPVTEATGFLMNGRGNKDRTRDTRFWRPLLYQLSYTPFCDFIIIAHPGIFVKCFFKFF